MTRTVCNYINAVPQFDTGVVLLRQRNRKKTMVLNTAKTMNMLTAVENVVGKAKSSGLSFELSKTESPSIAIVARRTAVILIASPQDEPNHE